MRFIDTNLFIRYFTRDDKEKAQRVFTLLKRVEKSQEIITTSPLVIFETIFILENSYKVPKKEIKDLMLSILSLAGFRLPNKEMYESALDIYIAQNISFADAFNAVFILRNEIKEIYSYDEDFDRVEGIKRVIP